MVSLNDYNMVKHRILHNNYTLETGKNTAERSALK